MIKAKVRFIIIAGLLLELLSATIYPKSSPNFPLSPDRGFLFTDSLPPGDSSAADSTFRGEVNQSSLFASDTWILVSPSSGPYTGTVTLSATLRKLIPPTATVSGRTISFKLDGKPVGSAKTDSKGVASISNVRLPDNLNVGLHFTAIEAEFAGDANYKKSSGVGALTVTYAPTELKADNITAYYGTTATLKGQLISSFTGEGLKDRVLTFFINNIPKGMVGTDANGVATLDVDLSDMQVGSYPILVTFLQVVGNYSPITASATLKVEERPTSLTLENAVGIYGTGVTLQATLSSLGAPLKDKTVSFTVNGNPAGTAKTNLSGIASLPFNLAGFDAGSYPGAVKADFIADNYVHSSASGDLTVQQAPTSLALAKAVGTFSRTADLSAVLTSGGSPLAGMTVSFKLNGTPVGDAVTGADGTAAIKNASISGIDAGEYKDAVTADFLASGNYASSSASGTLLVEQAPSAITVLNTTGTYDGKVTLSARLIAASSGIPLGGRTLIFKINGTNQGSAVTESDGVAALPEVSIAGIPVGTYDDYIETVFAPLDGNYAPSSGKGRLDIGLAPTCISIEKVTAVYGSKVDLEATLTAYGAPLKGKPVEFSINGQFVGASITGADGKAIKNCIDLTGLCAGLHPGAFCAAFVEANPYKGSSSTADIEITKASTRVSVETAEVQYSDAATLTAVVSSASQINLNMTGGTVELKYQLNNGPQHILGSVSHSEIRSGKLFFDFEFICGLDPDTYKILAEFTPADKENFIGSCSAAPHGTLLVEPEDALVEYTGPQYFSLPSLCSNNASLTLSAIIKDTADFYRGDISNARVEFREAALGSIYNDWKVQATNLPVFLTNTADNTTGISTTQPFCRPLSQAELNNSGTIFDVYTKVRGYYTKLSDPSLVTIGIPGNDYISGGGFIVPKAPAGKYSGMKDARTDFGFTMKYNKSCETVPGQASIIIRGGNNKTYQVISSTIGSLTAYTIDKMPGKAASFSAAAELIDISNPFNQVILGRDLCLTIEIYDDGKDNKTNSISITLRGPDSELLYSNNWDGSKTALQTLDMQNCSGTIKILGSALLSAVEEEMAMPKDYALYQNYPNPFNPSTTIQFDLPEDSRVKIAVYDILGKEISQIVNHEIPAGRHQAVWNSLEHGSFSSGIYFLRITAESLSSKRNLVSTKKMLLVK